MPIICIQRRRGQITAAAAAVGLSVVAVMTLVWMIFQLSDGRPARTTVSGDHPTSNQDGAAAPSLPDDMNRPVVVYCAVALKRAAEAVAQQYEDETGTPIQLQFGPSQTLLANIEISRSGDLYLSADESYLAIAADKQLLAEQIPLAEMTAVLAVAQGNPKQIRSLDDVFEKDVTLALANPDAAAISALVRRHLAPSGTWEKLLAKTTVQKTSVTEVAADVGVGAVDATIVWDVVARDFEGVEAIEDKELGQVKARVAAAVLASSEQPRAALRFARYLAASDRGLAQLASRGYRVIDGDAWEAEPELVLYAGAMLRPAIEETVNRFEQREGIRVTRVYNGCGILVAEMKAGRLPDAYFACDREFMNLVRDDFPDSADVATNQLVILVQKGNPFKVRSLADLTQENLRVGIGHEKQCAMGWLTQRAFRESKLTTEVMKNVVVQSPTGDMLVNQMLAGSLDAAVAYLSNAVNSGDKLDAIAIENLPCAIAVQPFGVAKMSTHKQLSDRLFAALRSAESKQRFVDAGFSWNDGKTAP